MYDVCYFIRNIMKKTTTKTHFLCIFSFSQVSLIHRANIVRTYSSVVAKEKGPASALRDLQARLL